MKRKSLLMLGLSLVLSLALAGTLFVQPAAAAPAPKDVYIDVNPGTSTPGGIVPDYNHPANHATYLYTITDGQQVNDTIPVQICMTGSSYADWTSLDVGVSPDGGGGSLPGVTLPGNETFLATATPPDCRNVNISIASGALNLADPSVSENFTLNFHMADANPVPANGNNKPQANFADVKNFHIMVTVLPAPPGSNVSCFLTDSSGLFLTDCGGSSVTESGSNDGRFTIVTNNKKGIVVATNPGQFYYNFVWKNTTGTEQTVTVKFARTGVTAQGTQAIHSAVFNEYLSTVNPVIFDEANSNGIPDGKDDNVSSVVVPAGSSLLVTYHLIWDDLGLSVPAGLAPSCEAANQIMSITGTVSGEGIPSETCTSGALGYRK
jgi:hypothetical protein